MTPTATATTTPTAEATTTQEATATASPAQEVTASSEQTQTGSDTPTVVAATPKPQTAEDEHPTVEINMEQTTTIYEDTLKKLREKGVDAVLTMNENVTWTIDVESIDTGTVSDVDLNVELGKSNIPEKLLVVITEESDYVEMSLAHDGNFGFAATMTVALDQGKPGQYANLYYYNEAEQNFEFLCASQINVANKASFRFEHASDYVIIISDEEKSDLAETHREELDAVRQSEAKAPALGANAQKEEPSAAERSNTILYLVIVLLICMILGIAIFLIVRIREER